jgi:8-oxo-dGTP pyrophosphatase MutT (NUDIX family)
VALSRPGARVICVAAGAVLLLRWRDPVEGFEAWEPPGGGVDPGESWEAAARRELREEAGLTARALTGPELVPRDYRWAGRRIACDDAFFLAVWDRRPRVTLEDVAALRGCEWVAVSRLDAVPGLEPPGLGRVLSSLRSARPSPQSR